MPGVIVSDGLDAEIAVDCLIIGGGAAGLTAALRQAVQAKRFSSSSVSTAVRVDRSVIGTDPGRGNRCASLAVHFRQPGCVLHRHHGKEQEQCRSGPCPRHRG